MPEYRRTAPRSLRERVYRALLRVYPRAVRNAYGDAMFEFFRDRLDEARRHHGRIGVLAALGSALTDICVEGLRARLDLLRSTTWIRKPHTRVAQRPTGDTMWHTLGQDLRLAIRSAWRQRGFSAIVIATLALGTGANTAMFSVVRGVLLRPLPFVAPEALVRVQLAPAGSISEPEFADLRRDVRSLDGVAAWALNTVSLTSHNAEPERLRVARVSDGFFEVLGASATAGRTFAADEERPGTVDVAVISHGLWQRRFGGAASTVGASLLLDGRPHTIVGVMPSSFYLPSSQADEARDVTAWVPLRLRYDSLWTRNNHYLSVIARRAAGATDAALGSELAATGPRWKRAYPATYSAERIVALEVQGLGASLVAGVRPFLMSLLGVVGFVLLIACANVAGLLLVRAEGRRKEAALRMALGASRARLLSLSLVEGLLYALLASVLGLVVAWGCLRVLVAAAPAGLPRLGDVRLDGVAMAFASLVAALAGVVFGLVTSGRGSHNSEALREGGKTAAAAARGGGRARRRLVAAEVAVAVVTLSGAGLMVRSLYNLISVDVGFDATNVTVMEVSPTAPPRDVSTADAGRRAVQVYDDLLIRVRAMPGVTHAAASERLPIVDGYSSWSILVEGSPTGTVADAPDATPEIVTADYFAAMGIHVRRGRAFLPTDGTNAPLVTVINETMARALWPGRDPIGRRFKMFAGDSPWATIVGVVGDVRAGSFTDAAPPTMYFPHAQSGQSAYYTPLTMQLMIRGASDAPGLISLVRRLVPTVAPGAPVSRATTLASLLADSVGARRFTTWLIVAFAALALLLAGVGIYGVISMSVTQRSYEIGVRMALGARRADVMQMIVGEGLRLAAMGALWGVVGAIMLARLARSLFVGVTSWDPPSLLGAVAALLLVAGLAVLMPGLRATAVDPNRALRSD